MNQIRKKKPKRKDRRLKAQQARQVHNAGQRVEQLKAELAKRDQEIADLREQLHPMYGVVNATVKPETSPDAKPSQHVNMNPRTNRMFIQTSAPTPDLMQATVAFDFTKVAQLVANYDGLGAEAAADKFLDEIMPIVKDMIFCRLMNQFCPTTLSSFKLGAKSPISTVIDRKVIWDAFIRQLQREGMIGSYENIRLEIELQNGKIAKIQRVNYTVDGDQKQPAKPDIESMYVQARVQIGSGFSGTISGATGSIANWAVMDRTAIARSVVGPHSPINKPTGSQGWGDMIAAADAAAKKPAYEAAKEDEKPF